MTTDAELENRFTQHMLDGQQKQACNELRNLGLRMSKDILKLVPKGRQQNLALTAVEEAVMWANKGISEAGEVQSES